MKTADVVIAANTIWVARNAGTQGSRVSPLLHRRPIPSASRLPPGEARLRRPVVVIREVKR